MAAQALTTRRSLFGAAAVYSAAGAALATPTATDANEAAVVEWARQADFHLEAFITRPDELGDDDPEGHYTANWRLQTQILNAPCTSNRVAALQLRYGVQEDLRDGERGDGLGVAALDKVIAYLEGAR